jgi:hypothetical protein
MARENLGNDECWYRAQTYASPENHNRDANCKGRRHTALDQESQPASNQRHLPMLKKTPKSSSPATAATLLS